MDRTPAPAQLWHLHALRTTRRLNFATWLQLYAPVAAVLGLVGLVTILAVRSQGTLLPAGRTLAVAAGLYSVAAVLCWWVVRRRFLPDPDALVRLEARLGLNNALSAARAGVIAWPPAPAQVDDGFRFRKAWLIGPAVLTVGCFALALLLPVAAPVSRTPLPPPLALSRAGDILNALEKEELADPAALEKAREQLQALLDQPPENFYSHHSLEAADTLESSLKDAAGNLGAQLQTTAHAAESLEKFDSSLSPAARGQLESDLRNAVGSLENAAMGASPELKKQLSQLDPAKLKQLDPAQLQKMVANLKAKAAACKNCQGKGPGQGKSEAEQALADLLNGEKDGSGSRGKPGNKPGRGGVDRGPGTGDLTFEKTPSDLATNRLEQIDSRDLSRSLPGDHLGTNDIEHQLDKAPTGLSAGGTAATGTGGDAVWRSQLMPSEQKVLRRYFK